MSRKVEFEETIRTTQEQSGGRRGGASRGPPPPPQKEDFAHKIGDALTQGSGPGGYLAVGRVEYHITCTHVKGSNTERC